MFTNSLGLSPLNINPNYPKEIRDRCLKQILEYDPESVYTYIASSGSSSENIQSIKFIAHTKESLIHSAKSIVEFYSIDSKDIILQSLPPFHIAGIALQLRASVANAQLVNYQKSWNAKDFMDFVSQARVSILSLVPAQVFDICKLKIKCPDSLRLLWIGGGKLSEDLYLKMKSLNYPIEITYGCTETASMLARAEIRNSEYLYQAFPHIQWSVSDDMHLQVSSKSLAEHIFWSHDDHYEVKKISPIHYKLEDCVEAIGENFIFLGRGDHFIKVLGENVNLLKLQDIVDRVLNPENLEAYVVSIPHDRKENEIVLVSDNAVSLSFLAEINKHLLGFEKISSVSKVTQLPKTDLGKIQYKKLQKMLNL